MGKVRHTLRARDVMPAVSNPEDKMRNSGSCKKSCGCAAAPKRKSAACMHFKKHVSAPKHSCYALHLGGSTPESVTTSTDDLMKGPPGHNAVVPLSRS